MGSLQRMISAYYWDINQSKWFIDIRENCKNVERHQNRIYIYFDSKEKAEKCIKKCEKRNIHCTDTPLEDTYYKTFRVDVFMNWKGRIPSRTKRNKEQTLD